MFLNVKRVRRELNNEINELDGRRNVTKIKRAQVRAITQLRGNAFIVAERMLRSIWERAEALGSWALTARTSQANAYCAGVMEVDPGLCHDEHPWVDQWARRLVTVTF